MHFNISTLLLLACACSVYFVWIVCKALYVGFDRNLRKVPGPWLSKFSHLPLNIAVLAGKRTFYIHALHERYGPFVRIAPDEIAVADIDAWRKIHRIGSEFHKGPWYQGQTPVQYSDDTCGVFGIRNNKTASRRRRLFQASGTKKVVEEWEPQIVQLVDLTVNSIKRNLDLEGKADVLKWWTLLTSDVLGSLAFGESFNNVKSGQKSQLVHDIEGIMPWVGLRLTLPWMSKFLDILPPSILGRFAPVWDRFTIYGRRAVTNTREALKGGSQTLFSKMIHEDAKDQTFPESLIEQEAANIIIAGTDTTSITLTYLTYAVLSHPKVQKRLVKEMRDLPIMNWSQLESVPYLNNVITEAMRLYPALPASLPRVVPPGGENFGKYVMPAGTIVSTQAWTFHRDPAVFPDSLKFDPDRWADATPAMKEHFMPWGGPNRFCVGKNIARLELLHAVYRFFRECGDVTLAPTTTEASMQQVDFFTVKPKSGVCEIVRACQLCGRG